MLCIHVDKKPGPATLIAPGQEPLPLTSTTAWKQAIKLANVADVPLPHGAYKKQLKAARDAVA